jgi:aspartyl protease family protein
VSPRDPGSLYVALGLALAGCLLLVHFARGAAPALGWALRTLASWTAVGVIAAAIYSQRDAIVRNLNDLLPTDSSHVIVVNVLPQQQAVPNPPDGESARFLADRDGHFRIDAMVDGRPIRFLVDTGASIVVLNREDARRVGFDPDTLAFTQSAATANGKIKAAPIVIPEIIVGPIRLTNVVGAVDTEDAVMSLLGMSFLSRLQGYEVSAGALTFHR